MKSKTKISNLIFWGYLILIYVAIIVSLIVLAINAKHFVSHKQTLKLGDYTNVLQLRPYDTVYLKGYTKLKVKYYPDTNLIAYNDQIQIIQKNNRLYINQGSDIELITSQKNIVVNCGTNLDLVAGKIKELTINAKDAHIGLAAGNLRNLKLNLVNCTIDLAATSIDKIVLDIKNTRVNVASMTVHKVTGYADSASILSMVHLFRTKIKLKGGAKIEAKKK